MSLGQILRSRTTSKNSTSEGVEESDRGRKSERIRFEPVSAITKVSFRLEFRSSIVNTTYCKTLARNDLLGAERRK